MPVSEDISPQQAQLANSLGISLSEDSSLQELMQAFDNALGQKYLLEQARWFIMSVYRHLTKSKWDSLTDAGLSLDQQYELAEIYVSSDKFKQSLITVLKDPRTRFTILGFAKARNLEKRVLSTTTKAFQHAREVLASKELVAAKASSKSGQRAGKIQEQQLEQVSEAAGSAPETPQTAGASVVNRRAARRGFSETSEAINAQAGVDVIAEESDTASQAAMSEEEFAELDEVLSSSEQPAAPNWTYQTNEDRLSLLLGVAAGCGFFALVLWMFL